MRRVGAIAAIIGLGLGLAAILVFRPWQGESESPRIVDRLPMDDIIGTTDILHLASDLLPAVYTNQIAFRDFVTPEFILSQGKTHGLDLQKPVFFFGSQSSTDISRWGMMIHVSDSSKILPGIRRFEKITKIKDSSLYDQRIFICPEYNLALGYGDNWLLITDRKSFKKYFEHALHARKKSIYPRWRKFIGDRQYAKKSLRFSIISKDLKKYGVNSALFAASADSSSLTLHARITNNDTIPFQLRPTTNTFERSEYTRRLISLNLDVDLKNHKEHPLYLLLKKIANKISFPLDEFFDTWDGELLFRQGGLQTIVEPYIVSELDENFNVTEVTKYKEKRISGFAIQLSTNKNRTQFLNRLYSKGILTQENSKVRMLYFPPMNMRRNEQDLSFYTSSIRPATVPDSTQSILWDFNYTPVVFTIDSIQAKMAYGKVNIGLRKIVNDNINSK